MLPGTQLAAFPNAAYPPRMIAGQHEKPHAASGDEDAIPRPDVSQLITEDDTPVDNLFSEKQHRLLTESLHVSWKPGFPFVAMTNVGVFVSPNRPPIVPDVLVTTHVEPFTGPMDDEHRSYFVWIYDGKVPEIVVEVVSNTKGNELGSKMRAYEHMGVTWYAVFDPFHHLQENDLSIFALAEGKYRRHDGGILGDTGLGLALWQGEYEGRTARWLRWQNHEGRLVMSGAELAAAAAGRADAEMQRATAEARRADALAAKLRELGVDPDSIR